MACSRGDGIGFSRSALVPLSLFALLLMVGFESAVWAYSVSPATPYTGSGYSSYAVCHMCTSAPMMGIQSIGTARGIYTSVSAVHGGVTTNDSAAGCKGSQDLKRHRLCRQAHVKIVHGFTTKKGVDGSVWLLMEAMVMAYVVWKQYASRRII